MFTCNGCIFTGILQIILDIIRVEFQEFQGEFVEESSIDVMKIL